MRICAVLLLAAVSACGSAEAGTQFSGQEISLAGPIRAFVAGGAIGK